MNRTFHHFKRLNSFSVASPIKPTQKTYVSHHTEVPTPIETKLVCPSCYNKNNSRPVLEPKSQKTILPKGKEGVTFVDNHKIENEQYIQSRIANRDRLARGASNTIPNFKNVSKETLQHHNEDDPNFFKSTDHNMVRARNKSKQLEELINKHPEQFKHKEKPDVSSYYDKCIGDGNFSYLLKSSSCPLFDQKEYTIALKRQMELQQLRHENAQYKEKAEDKDLLRNSMNEKDKILKAKNDHHNMMKKQCVEQNGKMIDNKRMRKENEKECDLMKEKEIVSNALRKLEEYKRELRNKRDHLNNICKENKNAQMKGIEKRTKEKNDNKQYTNTGYIKGLLCQHGCNISTCSICLKPYPRRVLTPMTTKKKK